MKYATFDGTGNLLGRYDSDIHPTIPAGAIEVPDILFFRSINESDGLWKLVNGEFSKTPLPTAELILAAHSRINATYQASVEAMTTGYPDDEVKSWSKQEEEARAWLLDNQAPTPWIDGAISARGITKADMIDRIMENAVLFAPLHGALTGKRQKLRDEIDSLGDGPTQEQLDAIQW